MGKSTSWTTQRLLPRQWCVPTLGSSSHPQHFHHSEDAFMEAFNANPLMPDQPFPIRAWGREITDILKAKDRMMSKKRTALQVWHPPGLSFRAFTAI